MKMRINKTNKNRQHISTPPIKQRSGLARFTFVKHSVPKEDRPDGNEDCVLIDQRRGLAAVFDGVGGSVAGGVASQLAAQSVRRGWKRFLQEQQKDTGQAGMLEGCNITEVRSMVQQLLLAAHEEICADGERRARARGGDAAKDVQATTVVLAAFCRTGDGYTMVYASAGDSRIYLLREREELKRLTADDGWLAKMVRENVVSEVDALRIDQASRPDELTEAEREHFEKRNGITQALGGREPVDVHIGDIVLFPGDRILLCTDGVHDNLLDVHIEDMMRSAGRTTVARLLIHSAIMSSHQEVTEWMRAKQDDMSAVVVTYH